ncbi:MAG: PaaI family thioesterase, partial [Acidimicrobiia bacterium]|nr:PaaI family thioesterase [Acidimicrobiia bacterium]
ITADMHVRYLGRPRTDEVVALATVVRRGSQLIVVECRVTDTDDHVVAVADCSMMRVPRRTSAPPD